MPAMGAVTRVYESCSLAFSTRGLRGREARLRQPHAGAGAR